MSLESNIYLLANIIFIFTGANKENKVSADNSTVKQETSSREQSKANNTIITRKDKVERHHDQARGPPTAEKILLNKDMPLNPNVTPCTEKKSNGTLKGLIKLPKGSKESGNVTIKTNTEKRKLSSSNVTSSENNKKPSQDSGVKVPKGGAFVIQKMEKHVNVTEEFKGKDRKQHKGHEKNVLEKHLTISTEKDKKPSQGNVTQPKEGSPEKRMVEQLSDVTTSTEKDRKLHQSNNLPKDGSSGKRKVERFLNVTAASKKDKKFVGDDETTTNKKVTSGHKKGETHVNVTGSTEKDKKLNQGNITPLKEASLGKTKVDKLLNVTNSTEKDKKNQSKVTRLKEKTSGMRNVTTSSEKRKTLVQGNETKVRKVTLGRKTEQKRVNITSSIGRDNKIHLGNTTIHKAESSGNTKLDSHHSVTMSNEKDKIILQSNETKVFNNITTEKKRVEKHLNMTILSGKDKKLYKSSGTLIKEGSSPKRKVDNVNVKQSSEKGKKFLQDDETAVLISATQEKDVNATTTGEKDKSLHHSLKEDASRKNKVNRDFKNITISRTHADRTTKLIDKVEVHNITATGFVITWEAPQGVFRNFTVMKREVWSERSSEDDAKEAELSQGDDLKADELYSANRTSSKRYTGQADRKSGEKFSQILAGSARAHHFKNLQPQRKYSVSLFGSGPHVRSKVHHLLVSTGK